ncbi:AP-4 complex accessory subunit RUSC2 [Danio aesculapii]|uniref:AP-4 complex accessory subunit RUSC2 n=1 Tax=Danio aesculapii TaxID=1142201 RepID=UPI0024C0D33B|nr:AP-4 complex accessory subunit RUSC2 [Danio aesculapii]
MDVSPKSGETLIVCRIHGQSVGWHLCNLVQTSRRPRSLNLTHSLSLPERGNLPREALDYGCLSHISKSSSTERADKKGTENSRGYESSPMLWVLSEDTPLTSPQLKKEALRRRCTPRWQNLFIPEAEVNEDEEDEDSDGDNLHKYHEGSSLQLQGNVTQGTMDPSSQAKENKDQGCRDSKGTPVLMDCDEQDWGDEEHFSNHTLEESENCWPPTENLTESISQNQTDYITDSSCNSSDGVLVNFSAIYNKTNNAVPAAPFNLDSPVGGPGTVLQDSSNPLPSWSSYNIDPNCNIYPLNSESVPSMEISDLTLCLQSQARLAGSTQNYYKLVTCDLSSQSSPSPPWSSLTSFSETQSQGSCSPPSEYFLFGHSEEEKREKPKTDQSEHQGDGNIEMKNTKHASKDQTKRTKERMKPRQSASREQDSRNSIKTPQSQSWIGSHKCTLSKLGALQNSCPCHLDTGLSSPSCRQHATSFAEIARCKKGIGESYLKMTTDDPSSSSFIHEISSIQKQVDSEMITNPSADSCIHSTPQGACASSPEVVRYTKAQRPNFLPIQPFVLQAPSGKQQSKALGSLLNQYISHKYSNPGPSKATCKSKATPHHLQPSSLDSSSTIHLEAATSSDTCSTCTSSPILPNNHPPCTQPCTLLGLIHQDLMNRNPLMSPNRKSRSPRSPEQPDDSQKPCSSQTLLSQKQLYSGQRGSENCLPEQMPLVQTQTNSVLKEETTGSLDASHPLHQNSSPAITSVTSLTSITSLISLSATGWKSNEELTTNAYHIFGPKKSPCVMREYQHGDSFSMTDNPPEEFSLSPEDPSDLLTIDLLHKRSMLKAVSLAVNNITAHLNSRRDPEEKIRLGNSLVINHLVIKQLYPRIQNILQDGLKAYTLDLIIGQRRNKLWNVIEATARPGSSTRLPDSLVSVVKRCSQLPSHKRLSVFFTDLLNMRALEFWIHHLYTSIDVVTEHYYQWGFLALAQGPTYGPLFQEMLHLLQPLSLLPFDLYLPSQTNLQSKEKSKQRGSLSHQFLAQSAQMLQMSSIQTTSRSPTGHNDASNIARFKETQCVIQKKEDEAAKTENSEMPQSSSPLEDKHLSKLRWARLFGSGVSNTPVWPEKSQNNHTRRPSEWLKLGASKVDLLAQSVWTRKWPER